MIYNRLIVAAIGFIRLEPYDGKLSSTVLRGESPRKGADLLDIPPNGGKLQPIINNKANGYKE